jgi:hypothetical protein
MDFSFDALSLSRHTTRRARARGCSQVPRSAFLEGARAAGGTKTCLGAIAKQKTAVPQGAALLSLAVLESDGRKREGSNDKQCGLLGSRKTRGKTRDGENVWAVPRLTVGKPTGTYARPSALGLPPVGGDSRNRGERGATRRARKRPQGCGSRKLRAENPGRRAARGFARGRAAAPQSSHPGLARPATAS